jgi:hypothetical protein
LDVRSTYAIPLTLVLDFRVTVQHSKDAWNLPCPAVLGGISSDTPNFSLAWLYTQPDIPLSQPAYMQLDPRLVYTHAQRTQLRLRLRDLLHQLVMRFGYIVEGGHAPAEPGEQVGAEGDEEPEGKLSCDQRQPSEIRGWEGWRQRCLLAGRNLRQARSVLAQLPVAGPVGGRGRSRAVRLILLAQRLNAPGAAEAGVR